jgi:hypothetical protein
MYFVKTAQIKANPFLKKFILKLKLSLYTTPPRQTSSQLQQKMLQGL